MLRIGRQVRGDFGRDQRQLVLGAKQLVGAVGQREEAVDLGTARQPEDRGDADAVDQRQQVVADEPRQQRAAAVEQGRGRSSGSGG